MKKILILGAGLSASSMIKYFLDHSEEYDWCIDVGDIDEKVAKEKTEGHPRSTTFCFDINDKDALVHRVDWADVVVSFLPARFHPIVAGMCVAQKTHMVTASYVSQEMRSHDVAAKEAGIALLNELGVDPGIDHMSAMRVVDRIRERGGVLEGFYSSTGGLIAPESDSNPWDYKFTWNPRNVVLAGQGGSATFIRNGKYKYIPYNQLFKRIMHASVPGVGDFEIYPNRNSLSYRETYNLREIPTMYRGTMRRPGYAKAWDVFVQLGMTDDVTVVEDAANLTWRDFTNMFLRYDPCAPVEEKLSRYLNIDPEGEVMQKLKWLGIFEKKPLGIERGTPAQILQHLLEEKWAFGKEDKDMIVMQHRFIYRLEGEKREIISSMVVIGDDHRHTAMSITVGTPVAIATKLLLNGTIHVTGVHVPVVKDLYEPILKELEPLGIRFVEEERAYVEDDSIE
ncbi:MAG: saccharopine dehydrogenase [Bacteroidetes bacterium]|nr:MAG: saccharopine dehydrogenase [Bacteroidota bacterium]